MENKMVLSFMCKNEEKVVCNMLNSVKSIVSNIVVLDTGSDDNTVSIIKNYCIQNLIPFEIYHHVFDNFANSRNLLKQYTVEYINMFYAGHDLNKVYWFSIDCDDRMIIDESINFSDLIDNVYDIKIQTNSISYRKPSIVKATDNGKWEGIFHETYVSDCMASFFGGMYISVSHSGNTWYDSNKHIKQALAYENYLNTHGDNITIRDFFYTAETFMLGSNWEKAMHYYTYICDRYSLDDINREYIYYSYLQRAINEMTYGDLNLAIELSCKANEIDPRRAESIYFLLQKLIEHNRIVEVKIFGEYLYQYNKKNPFPNSSLYVFEPLYDFLIENIYNSIKSLG